MLSAFLGALAKFWEATVGFITPVRPHWTARLLLDGFSRSLVFKDFSKICREKFNFYRIKTRTTGTLHKHLRACMIIRRWILLIMRNFWDKIGREDQNPYLLFNYFFLILCPFLDMWENTVELERPHITMWRKRFACWITKGTSTYSEYVCLFFLHDNNGFAKAPRCYVTRTLPDFFILLIIRL
jgi:hypothetical protein